MRFYFPTIVMLFLFAQSVYAESCNDNFSAEGNLLTGKIYKTWAHLPSVKQQDAFKRAHAFTTENGFTILSANKDTGIISAVQSLSYEKGKTVPLIIAIKNENDATQISISYTTPLGSASPENIIKQHFCLTVAAASTTNNVSESTPDKSLNTATPIETMVDKDKAIDSQRSKFEKNGLPCVEEICLGDSIADLQKVAWDKAKSPFSLDLPGKTFYTTDQKLRANELKTIRNQYKGDTTQAAPYLADKSFDNKALSALARVNASCQQDELQGTYKTKSGNPTKVSIALTSGQGSTDTQQWKVIKITRMIPSAISNEQQSAVETEVSARYKKFDKIKLNNPKPGDGRFLMNTTTAPHLFGFYLYLFQDWEETNRLKLHPLCGGSKKVNID